MEFNICFFGNNLILRVRSVFIAAILIVIFSLIIKPANAEKLKIGVSVPLSGKAASYGTDVKNGLIFANKYLANDAYELIIEDDRCSDKEAVNVAHKFVDIDHVKYVLGFGCSGTVLASAPVYEKAKVTVIASGTGAPNITSAGDYIFRTKPTLNIAGQKLYQDAASKFKIFGAITEETAYCQGLTNAFMEAGKSGSLSIINENFLPETTDFRSILTRLKFKKIEALFINTQGEEDLISIFKLVKDLNLSIPVYATFHPSSIAFLNAFKEKADGVIFADTPFNKDMLNKKGLEIYSKFEKEYGPAKSGEHFVTLSYIAFSTLHAALESGENVKDFLYKNKFNSISDEYSFDHNGDIVSDKITYVLKIIANGKPVNYSK